ncbi:MAG TPA: FAD:protein FMN transferase [Firmicutes bacterium]|nr:FAD:protein FMN transferase [Bacillota bacterium]
MRSVTVTLALALSLALPLTLLMAACTGGTSRPAAYEETRLLMDTVVRIQACAFDRQQAQQAVTAALDEIARLDHLWNPYLPESEVSRINGQAGQAPVTVSPDTMRVLEVALEVARLSGGAFDPTIGPLVKAWGFAHPAPGQPAESQPAGSQPTGGQPAGAEPGGPHIPGQEDLRRARAAVDYRQLQLDTSASTAFLKQPGMALDLGAIAKGYAVDRAVQVLREHGVEGALVVAGGSVFALGKPSEAGLSAGAGLSPITSAWRIAIQHPRRSDQVLGVIPLRDQAVDTSGDYQRFFEEEGTRYHHILDPHTGYPARLCQSVTVVAPQGVWADALATAIFVLGPEGGLPLLNHVPGSKALVVDTGGKIHASLGFQWEPARQGDHFP